MTFLEKFKAQLEMLPVNPEKIVVGYSGGLDSHVLLHACHALDLKVRAIHVHHGIQTIADDWVSHCQQVCQQLSIPLDILYVDGRAQARQSPEDAARIARYLALSTAIQADEQLLTAQHADDQAETVLLQFLRGGSAAGLSAMPAQYNRAGMLHSRPLLAFSRQQLTEYATENKLSWVDDPSNENQQFQRNFIRQSLMPLLIQRWPSIPKTLMTTAVQQQENLAIMEDMAAIDLAAISTQNSHVVSLSALSQLSEARQRNVLRYWIYQNSSDQPTRKLLHEICQSVITAGNDAAPAVKWGRSEIRRFQEKLYLLSQTPEIDVDQVIEWPAGAPVSVPGLGLLKRYYPASCEKTVPGIKSRYFEQALQIRFRQGGERIRPAGQSQSKTLKSLLNSAQIPPWQRQQIPLIYHHDVLIAVTGVCVAEAYAEPGGWQISAST